MRLNLAALQRRDGSNRDSTGGRYAPAQCPVEAPSAEPCPSMVANVSATSRTGGALIGVCQPATALDVTAPAIDDHVHTPPARPQCPTRHSAIDQAALSNWWRIHHADSAPLLVSTVPEADAGEMQRAYPAAASVEPYSPPAATPDRAMTASDEAAIRAWLAHIDETNPTIIADVMGQCQRDADARAYFVGRARVTQ